MTTSSLKRATTTISAVAIGAVIALLVVQQLATPESSGSTAQGASDDRLYAVDLQQQRASTGSVTIPYTDLRDALPNVRYEYAEQSIAVSHDLVVGRITDSRRGRAYSVEGVDGDTYVTGWDGSDVLWRSVFVTLEPDDGSDPIELEYGLNPADDAERFGAGMRALGHVAVLTGPRPEREDELDPEVKGVAENGALVIAIADDGTLDLPLIADRERVRTMLAGIRTLDDLRTASKGPGRTVSQAEWEQRAHG